jgi:hypothetical protein
MLLVCYCIMGPNVRVECVLSLEHVMLLSQCHTLVVQLYVCSGQLPMNVLLV